MSTAEMSVGQEQLVSFDDSDWPIDIKVWTAHQLLFGRFASTFFAGQQQRQQQPESIHLDNISGGDSGMDWKFQPQDPSRKKKDPLWQLSSAGAWAGAKAIGST